MHIILDRGHGIDTPGKRSPIWKNGTQLIEWEFNQRVIDKVEKWLVQNLHMFTYEVFPKKKEDIHRDVRKYLYNKKAAERDGETLVISVHGDAFSNSTARGGTCFTSRGETKSDSYAELFKQSFEYYKLPVRTSKERNFTVLMGANYSAVLIEMGFYTNYEECMFMLSNYGTQMYANVIIRGLNAIFNSQK